MSLPNHIRIKIFGNFQPKIGLDDWLVNNVYKQIMIQLVTLGEIHTWTTIAGDMWGRRLSERVCDQQLITPPVVPPWTESGLTGSRLEWKKTRTWLPFENWSDRRASGLKESNYFGRSMRIRERGDQAGHFGLRWLRKQKRVCRSSGNQLICQQAAMAGSGEIT